VKLAVSLHVLLLDLLCRAQRQAFNGRDVIDKQQHQQLCIALSKIASLSPNVQWYVNLLSYFHPVHYSLLLIVWLILSRVLHLYSFCCIVQ